MCPGQDGPVRVVDVRTGGRVIRQPTTWLSPLEAEVHQVNNQDQHVVHVHEHVWTFTGTKIVFIPVL